MVLEPLIEILSVTISYLQGVKKDLTYALNGQKAVKPSQSTNNKINRNKQFTGWFETWVSC